MGIEHTILNRSRLLLGDETMSRMADARVIIFGVGGVGSWCAESLVRTGVRHLTIVDSDCVCVTNINRQLMANTSTIGQVKVDALRDYLLLINPEAEIETRREIFCAETATSFDLDSYDYIIDAIDTLKDKMLLIEMATATKKRFFSSMGAALKLDPTRVKVAEFSKVTGCPLARALRQRFRKQKRFPKRKFLCVYSDELLENLGPNTTCGADPLYCPKARPIDGSDTSGDHYACSAKVAVNGSLQHITAMFGLTLAGLVIKDIYSQKGNPVAM